MRPYISIIFGKSDDTLLPLGGHKLLKKEIHNLGPYWKNKVEDGFRKLKKWKQKKRKSSITKRIITGSSVIFLK